MDVMKPYGLSNKIRRNLPDHHPEKGYVNWWENDMASINKGSARQKAKREIVKELDNE